MSAICGWINLRGSDEDAARAREAMTAACAMRGAAPPQASACAAGVLIAAPGLSPLAVRRDGDLLVALVGRVTWQDADLARTARDAGEAVAAARAYASHGAECLARMRGPFGLAILDGARRRGLIAIDRIGIRSMFFAPAGGGIVFGDTATAVAAHPAVGRRVSEQGIFNYLYSENVPSPGSIFEGVRKLLPAQRLSIDGPSHRTEFYWALDYSRDRGTTLSAQRAEFRQLLQESVSRAVTSDRVGAFLSGGTDSSTVAGMLTQVRGQRADTYSIGFEAEGFDEMEYARITARHFGCNAHEYYVTPRDVVEAIPLIAAAYDEPFGNASAIPTYFCAKLAHDDGKALLLAGDGGDEIFGGNARYAKQKVFEWYGLVPSFARQGLLEPLLESGDWVDKVALLRKARSYVRQARVPLPDRLETYNFLEREALTDIFDPGFLAAIDPHQPRDVAREAYERTRSPSAINRMLHLDLKETLADNDLRKVNRTCELAGIEVHYPLLDEEMVEFSGRLSPVQKVRGLKLRPFFKESLSDFLPDATIAKSKHGFGLPFGLWMERDDALRDIALDSVKSFMARGYMKRSYIERLLQQHQTTHATYFGVMIWIVMMLERWLAAHEPR